ncbi:cytochrome P450 [Phaeosphaeria sp. MPI-PUGE-AT-0046c]|nr:cytochrome P450 [Phaeosphaeria sp. MPI-PUGE-AT-0046c]
MDSREPPVVRPKVPFIGHIIGLLTDGPNYMKRIANRCKHPIFTLPMLNGKTYVVTDPTIAQAVQRASSTLDFDEIIVQATPRLVGLNNESAEILRDPTAKQEGRTRMVHRAHTMINKPLLAQNIANIAEQQLGHFGDWVNHIKDGQEVDLYKLITTEVVAASMFSFYGPHNPFAVDPQLIDRFWEWDDGNVEYAMNICRKITARKAYYGMEACVQGFLEYTENGLHSEAQPFLAERRDMHFEGGITPVEHARLEMGIAIGFNSNASVTSFWVVNNVFANATLLEQIREEIYNNAFEAPATIYSSRIRDSCPLINSVWRETMRHIAPMTSARVVLEDTILSDTYLLRKGNVVQIAGAAVHFDENIWGPDAASFNPHRFVHNWNGVKSGVPVDSKASAVHPAAYRCFGGGTSLCPGRHFAQMEITSLAAVLAMGFDFEPLRGQEKVLWDPPRDEKRFPLVVIKPTKRVKARMVRRKGWEDVKWDLKV